jgi:hypothetical protein
MRGHNVAPRRYAPRDRVTDMLFPFYLSEFSSGVWPTDCMGIQRQER